MPQDNLALWEGLSKLGRLGRPLRRELSHIAVLEPGSTDGSRGQDYNQSTDMNC